MIEGKAAWSFTLMFLEMWQVCKNCDEDFSAYYHPIEVESDGFVLPYGDSPLDTLSRLNPQGNPQISSFNTSTDCFA